MDNFIAKGLNKFIFYLIFASVLVILFNKYQEGIRLNSGAVPAAVSSDDFLQLYATERIVPYGKAAKNE